MIHVLAEAEKSIKNAVEENKNLRHHKRTAGFMTVEVDPNETGRALAYRLFKGSGKR